MCLHEDMIQNSLVIVGENNHAINFPFENQLGHLLH